MLQWLSGNVSVRLRSITNSGYLYTPSIPYPANDRDAKGEKRSQILVWKRSKETLSVANKMAFRFEPVSGATNQYRLRSVNCNGDYVYAANVGSPFKDDPQGKLRAEILLWKRQAHKDILDKARFTLEVTKTAQGALQVRLRSVHYQGCYVYVPSIEWREPDADKMGHKRGQVLIWKGKTNDDVQRKATFLVEPM